MRDSLGANPEDPMSAPVQSPLPTRPPTGVLVASTLCWIWGVICSLSALALGMPSIADPKLRVGLVIVTAIVFLVCGVLYCVAGFLIRRRNPVGGWIAIISAGFLATLELTALATSGPRNLGAVAGFAINLAIVLVLIFNWPLLRIPNPRVGA